MATGTLRVSPEKLQQTASSFESSATNVQNLTRQMTETVTSLSGQVWSGEAATAYVNKFNGLQDDMDRIYKMIKEHSDDLIEIARTFDTSTQTITEMIESLSSDVIV